MVDPAIQLIRAIERNDIFGVRKLLARGLNPNNTLSGYPVPIEIAIYHSRLEILNILLEDPLVDPCIHNNIAICKAVARGNIKIFDRLIQDPRIYQSIQVINDEGVTRASSLIGYAANHGSLDIMIRLLKYPFVDPSYDGNLAIRSSLREHQDKCTNLLFQDKRVYGMFTPIKERITHIDMVSGRMIEVCFALQDLELPALITLKILNALIPNKIRRGAKWDLIVAVKHFRRPSK